MTHTHGAGAAHPVDPEQGAAEGSDRPPGDRLDCR